MSGRSTNFLKRRSLRELLVVSQCFNHVRIDPKYISNTKTFAGEEQVFSVRRNHWAKIALVRVNAWAHILGRRPYAIGISETDIQITVADIILTAVNGDDHVALVGGHIDVAFVMLGVDDRAKIFWHLINAIDQTGSIDVGFPIPFLPHGLKIERAVVSNGWVDLTLAGVDYWPKIFFLTPACFRANRIPDIESVPPVLNLTRARSTRTKKDFRTVNIDSDVNIRRMIGE